MRRASFHTAALCLAFGVWSATAATHYVDVNGTNPVAPYLDWSTAATNVQYAVDTAVAGDLVLVTNGIYSSGVTSLSSGDTRVAITNAVTLQSVNGPAVTIIDGGQSVRCVALKAKATIVGFTLTNGSVSGAGSGGAVCGDSVDETVIGCVLAGSSAASMNAIGGGGAYYTTLRNCIICSNSCTTANVILASRGGGAFNSVLVNCLLYGNHAQTGGGAYACTLSNCTLVANSAEFAGGGSASGISRNCLYYKNSAGGGWNDFGSTLSNCCAVPLEPGGANLATDPQLASFFHLSSNSPCIGAGNPAFATGTDLEGESWGARPAIGCDEVHPEALTGPVDVTLSASQTNFAVGFNAGFTALIRGSVDSSYWDFGDGTVVSNQPIVSHQWTLPGNYSVVVRAFNHTWPEGISATGWVQVVTRPVHYAVWYSSTPAAPYTSWATAARTIQQAVDAAKVPGALVLVTNGLYNTGGVFVSGLSNRVAITNPVTVRSANGPGTTVIAGAPAAGYSGGLGPPAIRCAYLCPGACLDGFTLTNGATAGNSSSPARGPYSGGAVCADSPEAVVTNCVLTGNVGSTGAGVAGATANNCFIFSNSAALFGYGGGSAYAILNGCVLKGNTGYEAGGGAYFGSLNNCLVISNMTSQSGGGASSVSARNCTLVGNSAGSGGGASDSVLQGCIAYYNSALQSGADAYGLGAFPLKLFRCCVNHSSLSTSFVESFLDAPAFVNLNGGDFHLGASSPCINAGDNAAAPGDTDLGGQPRVVGGTVDAGAYEYQSPTSVLPYYWARSYGLALDGSADFADPDGDGANNWQERCAGTIPTNANSVLKLLSLSNSLAGLQLTWTSSGFHTYFLERATNLASPPAFQLIQRHVPAAGSQTRFLDTSAPKSPTLFYRVGLE